MTQLSIIMPALDEAAGIGVALDPLQPLRAAGHEVIVVDGGSRDGTPELARALADRVLVAQRGGVDQALLGLRATGGLAAAGRQWGRFDVRIDGRHPLLPLIGWLMNRRSRLSGIATGDQAMFVRREAFARAGGFPALALMEDVALSKRLKRISAPLCLRDRVVTSGRRWESRGVVRTIVLMWRLRLGYFFGASPERLHKLYNARR